MASYLKRATGMANKAVDVVKTRMVPQAVEYYNTTMAQNAEYVVTDKEVADKLAKQLFYTKLAKIPEMIETGKAEMRTVERKWADRMNLQMSEVGLVALFAAETSIWFLIGNTLTGNY